MMNLHNFSADEMTIRNVIKLNANILDTTSYYNVLSMLEILEVDKN